MTVSAAFAERPPMTEEDRTEFLRAIAVFVKERVDQACAPLRERIIELEKRGVDYKGVYQRAALYRRGDIVTYDGSMFVAVTDIEPNELPGNGGAWCLAVKRGQDGAQLRSPTKPASRVG
jgi:hypothetical protein